VLPLHVQDEVLHLKRQLIGIAIGTTASVGQSFDPAILVSIKDLVAGLAGDSELPAKFRQWLAGYTHAVGWAIDPKLRLRKNWRRATLLGILLVNSLSRRLVQKAPVRSQF
jgi:hypothetical protein